MILYCKCERNDQTSFSSSDQISEFLAVSGLEYVEVADFCEHVASSSSLIEELEKKSSLTVIACFPRALEWLFYAAGIGIEDKNVTYFNLREQDADTIIGELKKQADLTKGTGRNISKGKDYFSWYPVIDYDRCTYCGQCLDFCLFGVYERQPDKKIKVVKPSKCKDKCPACARICPHVAIMFPKLAEKPINGSAVIDSEDNPNVKVNVQDMLGDDIYTALAARKKRAKKNLLKSRDKQKAESERKQCSCGCKKD